MWQCMSHAIQRLPHYVYLTLHRSSRSHIQQFLAFARCIYASHSHICSTPSTFFFFSLPSSSRCCCSCCCCIHVRPYFNPSGWLAAWFAAVGGDCGWCGAGPTGLGASFNRKMWAAKGKVLSTEMRAFSNANGHRGMGSNYPGHPSAELQYIGTSAFGPNLNIIRDPRYGRNNELPGK